MDIFIHSFIHSSSSSSCSCFSFFRARNRSPPLGGAVSGSFLLVARTMTKDVTHEDIGPLNTAQLIALCRVHSIGYADKATQSEKTNDAKRNALWANLPKTSETTRGVKDAIHAAMLQLNTSGKMDRFEWLLRAECKQLSTQVGESLKTALQTVEETPADEDMLEGQATPEKK